MPRRTTYAVAIETRAKAIQEALGVRHYDACLVRIDQIRRYADILETEILREREANPQHVRRWKLKSLLLGLGRDQIKAKSS